MDLACSATEPYLPHLSAMLHSALSHTPERPFRVWLIHGEPLSETGCANVKSVVEGLGAEFNLLQVTDDMLDGFRNRNFNISCWYRILLPQLVPHLDRVIYLDADIIVTDSLRPLWQTELEGHLLGAVSNPLYGYMPNWPRDRLGIEKPEDYPNTGVLLMDLSAMRKQNFIGQLRDYARQHPENLLPEQDAVAALLKGEWLHLHPRWNMQSVIFDTRPEQQPFSSDVLKEALCSPAIVHYCGCHKPWHYLGYHQHNDLYFQHLDQTPWPRQPLMYDSLIYRMLGLLPLELQFRIIEKRGGWRRLVNRIRHLLGKRIEQKSTA